MMHFIGIALAVFGGLWLFVQWAEWRERRAERRAQRLEMERLRPDVEGKIRAWPMWLSLATGIAIIVMINIAHTGTSVTGTSVTATNTLSQSDLDFLCEIDAKAFPEAERAKSRLPAAPEVPR